MTETLKIKGTVQAIHDVESISDGKWEKQMFSVTNNDGYDGKEELYAFELFGDKTSLIEGISEGSDVEVSYNIGCRHYKDNKYFTTLKAWKVTEIDNSGF